MGLGYLAGSLRAAGHDVALFDGEVERETLDARLGREPCELVGISSPHATDLCGVGRCASGQGAWRNHHHGRAASHIDAR